MKKQIVWLASAASFSLIGLLAGYLTSSDYTIAGAVFGLLAGLGVTAIAFAGEKVG